MKRTSTLSIYFALILALLGLNINAFSQDAVGAETLTTTTPDCSCDGGKLSNGSFEDGTKNWVKSPSGTNFYTSDYYKVCGAAYGVIEGSGSIYQEVTLVPGSALSLTAWGGTHDKNKNHQFKLSFYDYNGNYMQNNAANKSAQVDYVVSSNKLQLYTLTTTAPAGAAKVRVEAVSGGDYLKMDAICLKVTEPSYCTDCVDNKLKNPSFEVNGTANWSSAGKQFGTDVDYKVCGATAGVFEGPGSFWQDVTVFEGSQVTLKIWGAIHEGANQKFQLVFLGLDGKQVPGSTIASVDIKKVVTDAPYGLSQYTVSGKAPEGAKKVRVQGVSTGNWIKVDAACLTIVEPVVSCNCDGNSLVNGSFEDGIKNWSLGANTTLAIEEFYKVCGDHFGVIKGAGSIYQDFKIAPKGTVSLSIYGGTHDITKEHKFKITFYGSDGKPLVSANNKEVNMDFNVGDDRYLKQYELSAIAPDLTTKVRIEATSSGDFFKIDAGCLKIVSSTPLPVTLVDFNAKKENATTLLNWSTTSETNSSVFEIQHSQNGKNWNNVGSVAAKGESSALVRYDFVHNTPANGNNFYRLKMIDADATYAFSRILSLNAEIADAIRIFPNPTADFMKVNVANDTVLKVQLFNAQGVLILDSKPDLVNGIDLRHLKQGNYIVKISRVSGVTSTGRIQVIR